MNSWELLQRLAGARRDDPLWQVLFERCDTLIRAALRSQLSGRRPLDAGLLDDLAQDVMERLFADERRVLKRFAGRREEKFAGYIRRITANLLLDQLRREAFRREVEESFAPEDVWRLEAALADSAIENVGDDPEAVVGIREVRDDVERTLRRISLDDRQRALNRLLFRLYFEDGYSIAQIARLRSVPLSLSSVARRITLLRTELRRSLAARRRLASIRPAAQPQQRKRSSRTSR